MPELPSFDSFVQSTRASPRPTALPARCPTCVASDRIPIYNIIDLHRHDNEPSVSLQDVSSTTCESSSSSCSSSSWSGDDLEDSEMADVTDPDAEACSINTSSSKKKYLTEQQRYEIVCHVLSGDKQTHVAKQYGVTRAAVSYLVKHHNEIMHRVLTGHAEFCCQLRHAAEAKRMAAP